MIQASDGSWAKVFESILARRENILHQEFTIGGVKRVFDKDEAVFFLGELTCVLTKKGWKFYPKAGMPKAA